MMDKEPGTTIDYQVIELDLVDSTNNYAMRQLHAGMAKAGELYLARQQFAGKGQRGKTWHHEPGHQIAMSLVLNAEPFSLNDQFLLSAATGLGCLYTVSEEISGGWRLKWPNDLYWNDRKAAGVLIENVLRGNQWLYAVIGVGMNLNQESFPENLGNPVSLKQLLGRHFEILPFAKKLARQIGIQVQRSATDPELILEEYNALLYKRGETIRLKNQEHILQTRLEGVNRQGKLVTTDGLFSHGEVEFLVTS